MSAVELDLEFEWDRHIGSKSAGIGIDTV